MRKGAYKGGKQTTTKPTGLFKFNYQVNYKV